MPQSFDHILNWTLQKGSHSFPGPDGGTCINEAAIVAAGFAYQEVRDVCDMPSCFSRVVAQYALTLNDLMPDDQRQRLLPYAARLGGTADTPEVECRRAEYRAVQAVAVSAARALDAVGLPIGAQAWRTAKTLVDAQMAAAWAARAAGAARAAQAAAAAATVGAWDDALLALDGVLAIGKQANPFDVTLVQLRME